AGTTTVFTVSSMQTVSGNIQGRPFLTALPTPQGSPDNLF
ncbi:MAG: hypothetical protein ACI92S_003420, partial [Planctomycetaceae bacterium]